MSITVTILTADSVISLIDPFRCSFYPCDAMLAQVVAIALRLCQCSVEVDGLIKLVFGNTVFKEIQVSTKIRVLTSGILSKTPDLENFSLAYRSSRCVIDLVEKGGRSYVINWTVIGQLSRQYLRAPTVDRCSLSRDRQALSTARWSRGSISDSWYFYAVTSPTTRLSFLVQHFSFNVFHLVFKNFIYALD